jgi:hypothetical protein
MTLRLDGFASVSADHQTGRMITKPLKFLGSRLELNCATSAAGEIRVEIQDADGKPVPGYSLSESEPIIGDDLARAAVWRGGGPPSSLAGKTVRLVFELKEADLYSMKFSD